MINICVSFVQNEANILIFGTSLKLTDKVKTLLSQCLEIKDLGEVDVILNIKLLNNETNGITLVNPIMWKRCYADLAMLNTNLLIRPMILLCCLEIIKRALEIN
jgi:hypothetical protein